MNMRWRKTLGRTHRVAVRRRATDTRLEIAPIILVLL